MTSPSKGKCPYCGHPHDNPEHIHGYPLQPDDGAISICFKCFELSCFVEGQYMALTQVDKESLSIEEISFVHSTRMLLEHAAQNK